MAKTKAKKTKKKNPTYLPGSRVKMSFKKHWLPPLAGLFVALAVFGFFNSGLISGKIAYYLYSHRNVATNLDDQAAATKIDKNAPPKILINKINVNAPVIFDQTTVNEGAFQKALQHGVVHYPKTAVPGQPGNVVIFGHSSGQWWAPGNYKFVFTLLDRLRFNDRIFVDYQGTRYIYRVNTISVVTPTDLSVLNQSGDNLLTLITCTPVGTSTNRLIIRARQIVPKVDANTGAAKAASLPAETTEQLPSSDSSVWHNLRELFR